MWIIWFLWNIKWGAVDCLCLRTSCGILSLGAGLMPGAFLSILCGVTGCIVIGGCASSAALFRWVVHVKVCPSIVNTTRTKGFSAAYGFAKRWPLKATVSGFNVLADHHFIQPENKHTSFIYIIIIIIISYVWMKPIFSVAFLMSLLVGSIVCLFSVTSSGALILLHAVTAQLAPPFPWLSMIFILP